MMPISNHVNTLFNKANNPYLLENMGSRAYSDLKQNLLTALTGKTPVRSGPVENFVKSIQGFAVVTTLMGTSIWSFAFYECRHKVWTSSQLDIQHG
jgi:hypothetical protein